MNARNALIVLVLLTIVMALIRFFQQGWIIGTTATIVVVGAGFVGGSMYVAGEEGANPRLAQLATRLRAIGLIVIGLGTLFGAIMLLL
ncbi:hypothetical protein BSZ35_10900 [Salinibacter sp. 10B]|uniref:hypothetical protein n=1 Tax=Salinibacter sp. 10B TaxID=1923971 RepID=UPI000CF3C300|nr:hypothetical protein [Salinibacter sp. 10B]PQJ35033.1 hypothetical protein BSZ35_10900 [Salinibacter sp. 10B]